MNGGRWWKCTLSFYLGNYLLIVLISCEAILSSFGYLLLVVLIRLMGTRDVRTQSARAQLALAQPARAMPARARAQSMPCPARDRARAQSRA
jgi:hypothetical protein